MKDKSEKKLLILIVLLLYYFGTFLVYNGIKDNINKKYTNYVKAVAFFKEGLQADEDTYNLVYVYKTNKITYTITSHFSTNILPEVGTKKTIYYNPSNPNEFIFDNTLKNVFLIITGLIVIIFTTYKVVIASFNLEHIISSNFDENNMIVGIIFIIFGIYSYIAMSTGGDYISLFNIFHKHGIWALIPILFVIVGMYTSAMVLVNLFRNK